MLDVCRGGRIENPKRFGHSIITRPPHENAEKTYLYSSLATKSRGPLLQPPHIERVGGFSCSRHLDATVAKKRVELYIYMSPLGSTSAFMLPRVLSAQASVDFGLVLRTRKIKWSRFICNQFLSKILSRKNHNSRIHTFQFNWYIDAKKKN